MCKIIKKLEIAKAELENGRIPEQLSVLLGDAIIAIEDLKNMKHIRVRFEDEEISLQEVIERYQNYRYGKE